MKPKAKVLANIKIWYSDIFFNLTLIQFSDLIYTLNANHDDYRKNIAAEYYKILGIGHLYDKFIKKPLKKLK